MLNRVSEPLKLILDGTSVTGLLMAWLGVLSLMLTILATLFTLVWTGLRIYELKTVQSYLAKRKKNAASDA